MNELIEKNSKIIPLEIKQNYSELAISKINEELKNFSGGLKEKTVSKFVASTLTHFCEENERFAEIVYKTQRTLSDCCAEVMEGTSNQISDIDVYRGAVRHYFPNADISFKMEILINGDEPAEEELLRKPKKKVSAVKHSKKETKSDVIEDIEDEDEEVEVNETIEEVNEVKQNTQQPKKAKPRKEKGPKPEIIQISLFESLFGEEK